MATNKLVVGMLLIVISIAAIIFFISLSWKVQPIKCWTNLNGSKKDILSSLKACGESCWSKHEFGKDTETDDCYTINLFSTDESIEKKDIEKFNKKFISYLEPVLYKETPYLIKVRYNATGKEISFVNVGVCGNKVLENTEMCENDDNSLCKDEFLFGKCTASKLCKNCICYGELNCGLSECKRGIPTKANPYIETDWCKYCKQKEKGNCYDGFDNDCDGLIDDADVEDCPPCRGPAYLHVDMWPFWFDTRMPIDEPSSDKIGFPSGEFWKKSLWRCEKFGECSGLGGEKLSREQIEKKWNNLFSYYYSEVHGSCSHGGKNDIECYKNYCLDNGQPEDKCDLSKLNYEELYKQGGCYGYPYGDPSVIKGFSVKTYDNNGIETSCVSTHREALSEHVECNSPGEGYAKECGWGACIKLDTGKEINITVRVAPRSGCNFLNGCDYLKSIKIKPEEGAHYVWNVTGFYKLDDCIGPPPEIAAKFPGVVCDSHILPKGDIVVTLDPNLKLNENFALILGSYLTPRYIDLNNKNLINFAKDVLPQGKHKTVVRTPSPSFMRDEHKDVNFVRTIVNFCKEANCEPMFSVIEDYYYVEKNSKEFKSKVSEYVDIVTRECKNVLGHECLHWDIGNEPSNLDYAYRGYSILYENSVSVIKQKLPNAIIHGLETYSHPTTPSRYDTTKYMVEELLEWLGSNQVDVVQVHWYPYLCQYDGDDASPEDLLRWTATPERQSISYASKFPTQLYSVFSKYESSKNSVLGVGEMNPKAACEGTSRTSSTGRLNEVHAAALWYADVLGILAENNVKYVQMHTLINRRADFALITDKPEKTPPAYTYELYSKYFGNTIVFTQSSSPNILNAHSSIDEDGNLYIILINKDKRDLSVEVNIKNYNLPNNVAHVYKLVGSSPSSSDTRIEYAGTINVDQVFQLTVPKFSAVLLQIKK